jgi:hypothetical protein
MSIDAIIGAIFGTGGVGAILIAVTAWRRLKRGAIEDDETIIRRLHNELKRQSERAEAAETRADEADRLYEVELARRRVADEAAWWYRSQLVRAGLDAMPPPMTDGSSGKSQEDEQREQ